MSLSDEVKRVMKADPAIAKAISEGWKLSDCKNGRKASRRMGTKIGMAAYRHGPKSPEVQAAIDEANQVSVMLTMARAEYNRILRDPPTDPIEGQEKNEPLKKTGAWQPVWSKKPYAKYRELQNIPDHWKLRKVVLIWLGKDRQELRVFALDVYGIPSEILRELIGNVDLPKINRDKERWDFALTLHQYETAVGER